MECEGSLDHHVENVQAFHFQILDIFHIANQTARALPVRPRFSPEPKHSGKCSQRARENRSAEHHGPSSKKHVFLRGSNTKSSTEPTNMIRRCYQPARLVLRTVLVSIYSYSYRWQLNVRSHELNGPGCTRTGLDFDGIWLDRLGC